MGIFEATTRLPLLTDRQKSRTMYLMFSIGSVKQWLTKMMYREASDIFRFSTHRFQNLGPYQTLRTWMELGSSCAWRIFWKVWEPLVGMHNWLALVAVRCFTQIVVNPTFVHSFQLFVMKKILRSNSNGEYMEAKEQCYDSKWNTHTSHNNVIRKSLKVNNEYIECSFQYIPTQLPTHGQWWSNLAIHRLHTPQCLDLTGFRICLTEFNTPTITTSLTGEIQMCDILDIAFLLCAVPSGSFKCDPAGENVCHHSLTLASLWSTLKNTYLPCLVLL